MRTAPPGTSSISSPDLGAAADALYGLDPDHFVAARAALVAEARRAGDRRLAADVGTLKRPTRSAWLVNLLVRDSPESADQLVALAGDLRDAHAGAAPAEVRRLASERTRLVDRLTRAAVALGEAAGYRGTEAVRGEVAGTLGAAIADPQSLEWVRAGRVERALSYAGLGPWGMTLPAAPDADVAADPSGASAPSDDVPRLARARARASLAAAENAAARTIEQLRGAEAGVEAAAQRLDRASQEVADLTAELRAAERAAATVRTELADQQAAARRAQEAQALAQAAVASAREELARLDG